MRAVARYILAPLDLTDQDRQDLVLAASEAASNVLEHDYPPSGLSASSASFRGTFDADGSARTTIFGTERRG